MAVAVVVVMVVGHGFGGVPKHRRFGFDSLVGLVDDSVSFQTKLSIVLVWFGMLFLVFLVWLVWFGLIWNGSVGFVDLVGLDGLAVPVDTFEWSSTELSSGLFWFRQFGCVCG